MDNEQCAQVDRFCICIWIGGVAPGDRSRQPQDHDDLSTVLRRVIPSTWMCYTTTEWFNAGYLEITSMSESIGEYFLNFHSIPCSFASSLRSIVGSFFLFSFLNYASFNLKGSKTRRRLPSSTPPRIERAKKRNRLSISSRELPRNSIRGSAKSNELEEMEGRVDLLPGRASTYAPTWKCQRRNVLRNVYWIRLGRKWSGN